MPPNHLPVVSVAVFAFAVAASLLSSAPSAARAGFACLSSPCAHGVCVDQLNSTYTCYCIDGYTGIRCQTNWDECWSSPCLNGGLCIDGIADYNCSCPEGYAGHDCELNVNECLSNPCQNNGTCMDFTNGFTCQCPAGYTGTSCEIDLAVCNSTGEILCKNGGECIEGPGVSFSCNCSPGWNGWTCEDEIDQCDSRPCKNGGVCINRQTAYSCACLFGYTGRDCDVALRLCEEHECQNHALCLIEDQTSVCYCVPDYHGKFCQYQYDECQLGIRCDNGGTCVDGVDGYTCTCPKGLTGQSCECAFLDDHMANCTGIVVPYYTTSGAEETTAAAAVTITAPASTQVDGEYPLTFETTFGTTTSPSDGTGYFSIFVTATTPAADRRPAVTSTELAPELQPYTIYTDADAGDDDAYDTTVTQFADTTRPATSPDGIPDLDTVTADYDGATNSYEYDAPTNTANRRSTTTAAAAVASRPATSVLTDATSAAVDRAKSMTTTTATAQVSRSTISYRQSVATDRDASTSFTAFYDEMSTDFDYNFTSFAVPVTDRGPSAVDRSCANVLCLNGGQCEKSKTGHKCKCTFGWKGEICGEKIDIKVSAFTGQSFLSHRLSNRSGAEISMEIRTLAPNGILFYAQVTTHMYMCLYLQDGLLKFQFSCGVQTMLFSETRYRVNTGHRLLLTAALEHAMSHSMSDHCKASLRVNETLAMSGEQAADTAPEKVKKVALLYLGGLPAGQNATAELPVAVGITGCISRLQIDEVVHNVYQNATDGYGVIECASLTCLSSPCQSYATCVEFGDSWNCLCPSGFVGKNCERSVCENNPCKFGATCVIYPGSGFICLCPLGKHGMYCEHDLEIGEPFFPGSVSGLSSFAAYSIPAEIHQSFELSMHFVPNFMDQIALMMYIGHDSSTDHVALSFIKGYIVLTWNLGAGARRIFTPKPINFQPKRAHIVKLGRDGKTAWLMVDNFPNVTGQSIGRLSQLNTKPVLYLGGHESPGMADLPHDLPLHTGFVGCMSEVKLKAGHVTVPLSLSRAYSTVNTGRSVSQCSTNECYRNNICQHNGACIQHGSSLACVCDDGWYGPVCSHRYNACDANRHNCSDGSTCVPVGAGYECDCPAGRAGKHCGREERLSDVRFLGKRSFLSVSAAADLNMQQFSVELEIKPSGEHGIVFFVRHDAARKKFMCLSLYGGVLELRISVRVGETRRQDDVLVVRSGRVLTLSEWHSVRVGRYRRKLYLWVDGMVNYAVLQPSEGISNFDNLIYFGGLPDLSRMPPGSTAGLPVPFAGCIRRLSIDYETITLNYSSITAGRNIADCDGTPCGGDLCHHGGSCWLDMDMKPHCHCLQEFTGDSCNKKAPCTEFKCQNKGHCVSESGNTSFVCKCPPGWDGPFCTKELPTGPPLFKGHGYLILSKLSSLTKREGNDEATMDNETQFISLNFSTVHDNGLLIWTSQEEWYMGLGIINGSLTVTFAQNYKRPNKLTAPKSNITNSEWHTVRLNVTKSDITLELDDWISDPYHHNIDSFNLNDNIIYLGGVPEEKFFLNDRQELFKSNFRGCIEQLTVQENVITDFKHYESVNVDVCDTW
ncbi:protein eyes shut [Acyrthosiphon pisum]|uniref:Protein eyes shut n=1 Tax=Acyrthosiphon pisum TaxID=7029 RepID=A0A8R2D6S4_ACYPI|nr:protein eyes shut [Acyrthosiphon pisum]|eukprot:XP_016662821.1 PREDICTED: protein eyes shut [Acyrthosiphon pisum]